MQEIRFCCKMFGTESNRAHSERVLKLLLASLHAIDVDWLREHPETPALYKSGVRYVRENGVERWLDIPTLIEEGEGDCEDLACARAAELIVREHIDAKPFVTFRTAPDGSLLYHIRVQWPNGMIEDPSHILGMPEGATWSSIGQVAKLVRQTHLAGIRARAAGLRF